jgi:hypothetical protein
MMPKSLRVYDWPDLLRLQPLVHADKSFRYGLIDRRYFAQTPADDEPLPFRRAIGGKNVLVTIAFTGVEPGCMKPALAMNGR